MKIVCACVAVFSLLADQALAADASALAPAKPAGIKKAQDADIMTAVYVIGGGALIVGIALLASDNGSASTPPAAATTTSTSS
jgi:hypothetical protein